MWRDVVCCNIVHCVVFCCITIHCVVLYHTDLPLFPAANAAASSVTDAKGGKPTAIDTRNSLWTHPGRS